MSGIYIHIPFCRQACSYCDFHFSTSLHNKERLVESICQEIVLRSQYLHCHSLESIYFGGGTPSLLTQKELDTILATIAKFFSWNKDTEITLEANPDDISIKTLVDFRDIGINRLSIGIQSFFDQDLAFMHRVHTASMARKSIDIVIDAGYNNYTIDLIYGAPTTTDVMWIDNIMLLLEYGVPHISAYALTVEPKTLLSHQINKKIIAELDQEKARSQMNIIIEMLTNAGYTHYEISNFALKGREAIHNANYWRGKPYLGIGPSAHSFNGIERSWNISNNTRYMDTIRRGDLPLETERLREEDQYNELILTKLRTIWGVTDEDVARFSKPIQSYFIEQIPDLVSKGLVVKNQSTYMLTHEGKFYADEVARYLFYVL